MKRRLDVLALVAAVGLMTAQLSARLPGSGQTSSPGPAPAGAQAPAGAPAANPLLATGPALVSPEVAPDRRVTFRFAAPNATQVTVTGISGQPAITMQKDERGVRTGTSQPLAPERPLWHRQWAEFAQLIFK